MHRLLSLVALLACSTLAENDAFFCPDDLADNVAGKILPNGSLFADDGVLYPPDDFRWSSDGATYRACVCKYKTCITKCCPHRHVYRKPSPDSKVVCEPSPDSTAFYEQYSQHHVLVGVACASKYRLYADENYTVLENGAMLLLWDGGSSISPVRDFCVDVIHTNDSADLITYQCYKENTSPSSYYWMTSIGMMISEPFLLATIVVYFILPELNRKLHGKCLICQTSTLFIAFLFLIILQVGIHQVGSPFCVAAAFIVHFSFLASFFWLNIMCFDMWWTFSGTQRMRGSGKRVEQKKFLIYSGYAWGCPLIMLIICVVMQYLADPEVYITPRFGQGKCWFGDDKAIFAYFYGPVAVLVFANIVMFVTTALKILKLKRETAMLKHSDSRRHDEDGNNKERFSLYLKLFVVMGVNWAMEVLSWATGGPEYLWYFTDLGNTLQGVLIFFIFVWKDKIKRLLVRRFSKSSTVNGGSKSSTRTSMARTSTRVTSVNSSCFTDSANTYPLVHTDSVVA